MEQGEEWAQGGSGQQGKSMDTFISFQLSLPYPQDRGAYLLGQRSRHAQRSPLTRPRSCIPEEGAGGQFLYSCLLHPLNSFPSLPDAQHTFPSKSTHAAA